MKIENSAAAAVDVMISVPARLHFSLIEQALVRDDVLADFRPRPAYLERPIAAEAERSVRLDNLPAIGEPCAARGDYAGTYAGLSLHQGLPHMLVLIGTHPDELNWEAAKKFAEEAGGELPNRHDALVLWEHRKALAIPEEGWMWTSEPSASVSSCAWLQNFGYGGQGYDLVSGKSRARAVRRVPIR